MADHAFLSASGSHRWLNCTAAPLYEAQFPDSETSVFAAEGTLAHKFAEIEALFTFRRITKRQRNARIKKLQKDELYSDEMLGTSSFYASYLLNKAAQYSHKPYVIPEVRVDFSDYVPKGFGTCDCVMIGDDHLHITDYKHGKGVEVSALNNSQMRLYALGALKRYAPIFGGIKWVSMAIVQPRITDEVSEEELPVEELLAWGEGIKPIAQRAYTGDGAEFKCGAWCRFCKGKSVCKARAENATALEDFKNIPIEGKMTAAERLTASNMLTDVEVADLLCRGIDLVAWYHDLQDYALGAILNGRDIPGYKVVAGRSNRVFTDVDKVIEIFKLTGYDETLLRKAPEWKSLSELEKLVGKKDFSALVGKYVDKPLGKPTLTTIDDKREPYNAAAADFGGATHDGECAEKQN